MTAVSCLFRLCRQRQLQSSLTGSARQATKSRIALHTRTFASLTPLYAQPIDVAVPPEQAASTPIITRAPSESPTIQIVENTLFCGNLAFGIDQATVIEAFSKYGTVTSARLASNRSYKWGGHNGGFCFVTLGSAEEAEAALKGLDGTEIGGRVVHVEHQQKGKPAARKTMLDKVSRPGHVFREPLSARDEEYVRTKPLITGTVSRTGTMLMTVAVTTNRRYLDADTKTHHVKEETVLVHDPEGILAEGDVVKYQHLPPDVYGKRAALGKTNVKHILKEIVTPFGIPVEERTPSLTNKPNPDKSRKRKRKPAAAVAG